MKKKTISRWLLLALSVLTGTTFVASCSSDDGIDLGDLDKTIGVGGDGFSLPAGSAKDTHLGDVLDIDDSDVIDTLANGDYYFSKADTIDPTKVKVKQVQFNTSSGEQKQDLPVTLFPMMASDGPSTYYYFGDPTGATELDDFKNASKIKPLQVKEIDFSGEGNDNIVQIESAVIDGTITLTLHVEKLKGKVNYIDQIKLLLPKHLKLKPSQDYTYDTTSDADHNILTLSRISSASAKMLSLRLAQLDHILTTEPSSDAEKAKGYIVFNAAGLKMHTTIQMLMVLKRGDIVDSAIPTAAVADYHVDTDIDMGTGFSVTHAEGRFSPDINIDPKETSIGDVPDFLEDENVSILLYNPQIRVNISNNIDVKGLLDATLVGSYFDEKTNKTTYKTLKLTESELIVMNPAPNGTPVKSPVVICRYPGNEAGVKYLTIRDNDPLRSTPISGRTDSVKVYDLAAILERIPQDLKILLDANADQTYLGKIDLYAEGHEAATDRGAGYQIETDYEFSAPLALEAGSSIVYNDSIDGWNEDIKDNKIDFYNDAYLTVEATVENNTLFDQLVIMKPQAIGVGRDAQGNAIEISDAQVDLLDEKGNVVPKATGLTIYKTGGNKTLRLKVSGSLENLDGVKFEVQAKVTSSNSKPLNTKDDISIEKITIKLNGRITIDLDK